MAIPEIRPADPSAKPRVEAGAGGEGPVAEIKGVAIRGAIDFVRHKKGEEGVKATIAQLPPEPREKFSKPVLATEYYPLPWLIQLQAAAVQVVGGERNEVLREMGRFACQQALTGVYKIFVKLGSPEYFFKKASQVFHNYFRGLSEDHICLVDQQKGYGRVLCKRFPGGHGDYCRRLTGFFEMILELSGGKNPKVDHTACAYKGAADCEWKASWS